MSLGLQLILSTSLVAAAPGCSWAHPGANPYRGDPAHALDDFAMPEATRRKLREMMAAHRYTDIATITRDDIVGANGYADLRDMHSGGGQVCHGAVDRSAWSAKRHERGLVYCADGTCVIVPTICNNVSLVSRKPDHDAVLDDTPIDIEPAAGPRPAPADDTSTTPSDLQSPLDFLPATDISDVAPGAPDAPGDGGGGSGSGSGFPAGGAPIIGGGGGSDGGGGGDVGAIGPGDGGFVGPIGPGTPPVTAVPEAPTWTLLIAGLALLAGWSRQRR